MKHFLSPEAAVSYLHDNVPKTAALRRILKLCHSPLSINYECYQHCLVVSLKANCTCSFSGIFMRSSARLDLHFKFS